MAQNHAGQVLGAMRALVERFHALIKRRGGTTLDPWLEDAASASSTHAPQE